MTMVVAAGALSRRLFEDRSFRVQRRFEVVVALFAAAYLTIRAPVFWGVADRDPGGFDPVGVLWWLRSPVPALTWQLLFIACITAAASSLVQRARPVALPALAVTALLVTTYRSSWGQLLWFENLLVLHLLVLGTASVLVRAKGDLTAGWPLACCAVATVVTYVLAGVAKARLGGSAWLRGDVLANHIAYSAARLRVLGASASPLASPLVDHTWLLTGAAVLTVAGELAAPVALLSRRFAIGWIVGMWAFHVVIAATMFVVFPYPLTGVAFLPVLWLWSGPIDATGRGGWSVTSAWRRRPRRNLRR